MMVSKDLDSIRWDIEFENLKDKDDLGAILEETWFLSNETLMRKAQDLFEDDKECSISGKCELLSKRKQVPENKEQNSRRETKVCKEEKVMAAQLSYVDKMEKAKVRLQRSYGRCKGLRKTTRVISLDDVPKSSSPSRHVPPMCRRDRVIRSKVQTT